MFEKTRLPLFTNVFDTVAIVRGKLLNINGEAVDTTANLATTDFIEIPPNATVRMADFSGYVHSSSPVLCLYDKSKAYVGRAAFSVFQNSDYYVKNAVYNSDGNIEEFTVVRPSAGGFIRICTHTDVVGETPVLTINEEIAYDERYAVTLNRNVRLDYSQVVNTPKKNGWNILPTEHIAIAYSQIDGTPINTVAHFTNAATNYGYNALKCDVRPTSDGELICCHDAGFTFDGSGFITTYDSANQTLIHDVTAETCLGYSFKTGEHPCVVGEYLKICRKYGKVAFITIRDEYMDVVIPKLLEELKIHNMMYSTIINCMTYNSLVTWRTLDKDVMVNYTLGYKVAVDKTAIDKAVALGYSSLCAFSLTSSQVDPVESCDFEYARECGVRVGQAIAYAEGSPEKCFDIGYDFCQIGFPWHPLENGITEDDVSSMIESAIGSAIGGAY